VIAMKIELFYTPGCSECSAAQARLKDAAEEIVNDVEWHELSVVEKLDYAVELGVLTLPSIAIDGELVFTSMPSPEQWREALKQRMARPT
jgi:thioredoxin 1